MARSVAQGGGGVASVTGIPSYISVEKAVKLADPTLLLQSKF